MQYCTQVGLRYNLPLLSPVDDAGNFTEEAGPDFVGKSVQVRGDWRLRVCVLLVGIVVG